MNTTLCSAIHDRGFVQFSHALKLPLGVPTLVSGAYFNPRSPLFAMPLAAPLARERITGRIIGGTVLTVIGIGLIVLL